MLPAEGVEGKVQEFDRINQMCEDDSQDKGIDPTTETLPLFYS